MLVRFVLRLLLLQILLLLLLVFILLLLLCYLFPLAAIVLSICCCCVCCCCCSSFRSCNCCWWIFLIVLLVNFELLFMLLAFEINGESPFKPVPSADPLFLSCISASVTRLCGFPQNLRISKVSCGKIVKFLFSKSAKIADFWHLLFSNLRISNFFLADFDRNPLVTLGKAQKDRPACAPIHCLTLTPAPEVTTSRSRLIRIRHGAILGRAVGAPPGKRDKRDISYYRARTEFACMHSRPDTLQTKGMLN